MTTTSTTAATSFITRTSPSIRQIASALAQARPTTQSASRILCLKLQEGSSNGPKRTSSSHSLANVAESFLRFSPRVQVREESKRPLSGWIFLDIASTSHLFHHVCAGEEGVARSAALLAKDLGFGCQWAVADTPSGAQAFTVAHPETICLPGEERDRLKSLPLPFLAHLEGLAPWAKPAQLENIMTFFLMLGFKTIGDLSRFTVSSLQERWGELGVLLWKRLQAQDRQPISPLEPSMPLEDYVHLDFPISLVSLLLLQAQKSVDFLFSRLQGRRLFVRRLTIILHCEYSQTQHRIDLEPNTPSRDRDLFVTLLEGRLSKLDLLNPIRDFELQVITCPEKARQLDFFEPRESDQDRVQTLFSLLSQSALKPGLYVIEPSILPEKSWRIANEPPPPERVATRTQLISAGNHVTTPLPKYGETIMQAPRPTRILRTPVPLTLEELEDLKILSHNPIERLEESWWEADESGTHLPSRRDYYFAVSPEGQCLWIFQDPKTEDYYLHGYFD